MATNTPLPTTLTAAPASRVLLDWRTFALAALVILLVYQVIVPFVMIIWTSFKTTRPGDPGFLEFSFTITNYLRAYATQRFWDVTWNTLYFSAASTIVAFVLGTFLSWVVERTNTPNIYTFWGMVWVHSLEMVPLAYLLISAAFQAMDPRLEEASVMTGAGTLRTLRRISLPLIMPAVLAAMLLLFITTVDTFEVPLLLGGRAGVDVYATEVYFKTSRTPTDWGLSSTYSMALLVISIGLLLVYFRLLRHGERYQTITGKDFRPRRIDLGRWKYATCAASVLLVFLITGLPFIIMAYASFLPPYEAISPQPLEVLTLSNYVELLGAEDSADYVLEPIINSTLLGIGTATVVMLVVSVIAYFVHKTRTPGRKALDFLAFSSIALPSVVLGAAFLWLYLLVPAPILGTLVIIGLAYLTKYMPFALRFVSTSMLQIHSELEEAAQIAGVPWWKNFYRIYLPLLKPGLLAGWFWVMVHAFRELTIALILARSENRTASVIIYDLWEDGSFQQVSAFGVLMFSVLIILVTVARIISTRYGIKEQV
jgi:iron(III) transport system permease protein